MADLRTGLIWKRCAEGLSGAHCATGRASAWTWNQLASLVERRCYGPAIDLRFFPNTPSSWFWSSSPYAFYSYFAWIVYFRYGYVYSNGKLSQESVRLVRGGQ